ncbi:MAG: hypothetical protein ACOX3S_07545 [Anaerolineae bacterium]|jgi:hypothetical protein
MPSSLVALALLTSVSVFELPAPGWYVDPGSGSYLIQLLIAAFVGVAYLVKTNWRRIQSLASRLLSARHRDDGDPD